MKKDSLLKIARKRTKIKTKTKKRGPCFVKYGKSWFLIIKEGEKIICYTKEYTLIIPRTRSVEHCVKQSSHFSKGKFFMLSDLYFLK